MAANNQAPRRTDNRIERMSTKPKKWWCVATPHDGIAVSFFPFHNNYCIFLQTHFPHV